MKDFVEPASFTDPTHGDPYYDIPDWFLETECTTECNASVCLDKWDNYNRDMEESPYELNSL